MADLARQAASVGGRIPRFFLCSSPAIPNEIAVGTRVKVAPEELHHLRDVLRLKPGDVVELLSEATASAYQGHLVSVTENEAVAEITGLLSNPSTHRISLIVGLAKTPLTDFITEKAVELGVRAIHFFAAEQSPVKIQDKKSDRLHRIAKSALKQSGYHLFPTIEVHSSLGAALDMVHGGVKAKSNDGQWRLLFCPPPMSGTKLSALMGAGEVPGEANKEDISGGYDSPRVGQAALQRFGKNAESYLIVGPEGGLSAGEITTAENYSYQAVSLGQKTLRTETAVIAACALIGLLRD